MEKQLEEFLERTAQAASNEACTTDQNAENEEAFTGSESEEHSGSESDHSSHHSHHSNSPSDEKQPTGTVLYLTVKKPRNINIFALFGNIQY